MSILLWDTVPDLGTYCINKQYRFRRVLILKSTSCSYTNSMVWIKMKVPAKIGTSRFAKNICISVHTGQCKRIGGCYNKLVVAFFSTGGDVKSKKIYTS